MNKQLMHIIRFFLGGYIIFIGIRLLIQVTDQDPSNRILLSAIATILSLAGAVSVIYSGRKLWFILKPEDNSAKDTEEDSGDSAAGKRAEAKRKGMNPMVDISDPLRSEEKGSSSGEKEDTLQQEQTARHEQPGEQEADADNEADTGTDDQQDDAAAVHEEQTSDRKHSMNQDSAGREEELKNKAELQSKAELESEDEPDAEEDSGLEDDDETDAEEDSGLEDDDETDAEMLEELETDYEEM